MKNKRAPERKTSDFRPGTEPHTLVLKKKEAWKIEMSAEGMKRFWGRHKIALVAVLAVLVAGAVTRYVLVGFASTADFYPSSCLGNWENVQNALGKPDLPPGADVSAFNTFNSAVMGTSTAQMFCGNFSGDTDINTLTGESFQSADLVVSWAFIFPGDASTSIITSGDGGGGGDDGGDVDSSSSDVIASSSSTSPSVTTSTQDVSSSDEGGDVISASSTAADDADASTSMASDTSSDASSSAIAPVPIVSTSSDDTSFDASSSPPTQASPAPTEDASSVVPQSAPADNSSDNNTDDTDVQPPAPAPVSDPSDSDASSPTSWLHALVGVAYADETSSMAIDTSTSGDDSSDTPTGTSYIQVGTSSIPESAPISVDTAAFQNIAVPSSTGDAVLSVVYSTDGVTWQPLVNIDSANWQEERYPIPIDSWAELEHLQVAFIGLGASSSPQIFLDAAGVEVSYADAPQPQPDVVASDTTEDVTPAPAVAAPPPPAELPPVQAFKQVFDPFAGQECSVTPFSESIAAGGGGSFLLTLTPPADSTSSAGSSPVHNVKTPFLYDASVGSLPTGISATVIPEGPGMDTIGVTAAATVAPGSYNAVVVYKERQHDGTVAPNFCQFNLVVTPVSF